MPIIAFGAGGAGAFIRHFSSESMGGEGDIGAKINAEVARTEISAMRLVLRYISYHF